MLIATTAICTISALFPTVGIYLFAFSVATIGLLMAGHGSRTNNAALVSRGIVVFTVGWFLAAVVLALFANALGM